MTRDKLKFEVGDTPPLHTFACISLMHVLRVFDAIIFIPSVLAKTAGIEPQTLAFITFAILVVAVLFFLQRQVQLDVGVSFLFFTESYSSFILYFLDAVKMGGEPILFIAAAMVSTGLWAG